MNPKFLLFAMKINLVCIGPEEKLRMFNNTSLEKWHQKPELKVQEIDSSQPEANNEKHY